MTVAHFQYTLAWWCFPLSKVLHWLGVSRYRAATIIAHGIHVRVVK